MPFNNIGMRHCCHVDKKGSVKMFSKENVLDPGMVSFELQGRAKVEILIQQYVPFMSVTRRPYGQFAYSGHN